MYKRLILVFVCVALVGGCGYKSRKGYFYSNNMLNFVRLEKFKDVAGRNIDHPYRFSEVEISTILKTIDIKKGAAFSKEEKIKTIFDDHAVSKLAPPIVKAFAEATPNQRIGFAFLVKDPQFIIRNDRLSDGWMWVQDGKLRIEFNRIAIAMTGDYETRGFTQIRNIDQARGLRTTLDLMPGQTYGRTTKELICDLSTYNKITEEVLKKEAELAARGIDANVKISVVREESIKQRLQELQTLKDENLITKKEFEKRKTEIIGEL